MIELPYHRRAQRHAVELPCTIIGPRYDEPVMFHATSVSAHGMFVPTSFPCEEGDHVVVSFRPPPANRGLKHWRSPSFTVFAKVARRVPVRPRGTVAHALEGRSGMGLQFCDLTRQERRALQRCLRAMPQAAVQDRPMDRGLPRLWQPARGRI